MNKKATPSNISTSQRSNGSRIFVGCYGILNLSLVRLSFFQSWLLSWSLWARRPKGGNRCQVPMIWVDERGDHHASEFYNGISTQSRTNRAKYCCLEILFRHSIPRFANHSEVAWIAMLPSIKKGFQAFFRFCLSTTFSHTVP